MPLHLGGLTTPFVSPLKGGLLMGGPGPPRTAWTRAHPRVRTGISVADVPDEPGRYHAPLPIGLGGLACGRLDSNQRCPLSGGVLCPLDDSRFRRFRGSYPPRQGIEGRALLARCRPGEGSFTRSHGWEESNLRRPGFGDRRSSAELHPQGPGLRTRMEIHTGEPHGREGGYSVRQMARSRKGARYPLPSPCI